MQPDISKSSSICEHLLVTKMLGGLQDLNSKSILCRICRYISPKARMSRASFPIIMTEGWIDISLKLFIPLFYCKDVLFMDSKAQDQHGLTFSLLCAMTKSR